MNRQGKLLKRRVVAVMLMVTLAAFFGPGGTGIATADGSDDIQVLDPIEDVRVGLAAEPITIELAGRFDDPAFALARFDTVLGIIYVQLFQGQTPLTVANFLNYVNKGAYTNSFIHRAPPNFVVQGGGFAFYKFDEVPQPADYIAIPADDPVVNEPGISNVRGTIAMAKKGGDPNSATNQWFFNLVDNSSSLDTQNGGFTVFGQVLDDGMSVVDAIANLQIWDLRSKMENNAFEHLPLITYAGIFLPDERDLVMVWAVEQMPELTFAVHTNRPDLVTASIVDDLLYLSFAKNLSGAAGITVRATSVLNERFVEDVFEVVIEEWGDLNADGEVTLADAVLALCAQAGNPPEGLRPDYVSSSADVNGDGKADASEAAYVLQKIAGLNR